MHATVPKCCTHTGRMITVIGSHLLHGSTVRVDNLTVSEWETSSDEGYRRRGEPRHKYWSWIWSSTRQYCLFVVSGASISLAFWQECTRPFQVFCRWVFARLIWPTFMTLTNNTGLLSHSKRTTSGGSTSSRISHKCRSHVRLRLGQTILTCSTRFRAGSTALPAKLLKRPRRMTLAVFSTFHGSARLHSLSSQSLLYWRLSTTHGS